MVCRGAGVYRTKKIHRLDAELAWRFNIDPFPLTASQKLGLKANISRLEAQDAIRRGETAGLDHDGIYNLYLTAYDNEELAAQARLAHLEKLVKERCNAATR